MKRIVWMSCAVVLWACGAPTAPVGQSRAAASAGDGLKVVPISEWKEPLAPAGDKRMVMVGGFPDDPEHFLAYGVSFDRDAVEIAVYGNLGEDYSELLRRIGEETSQALAPPIFTGQVPTPLPPPEPTPVGIPLALERAHKLGDILFDPFAPH